MSRAQAIKLSAVLVFCVQFAYANDGRERSNQIGIDVQNYLSDQRLGNSSSKRENVHSLLVGQVDLLGNGQVLEGRVHARGLFAVNETDIHSVSFRDLYFGSSKKLFPVQLRLGRKRHSWNELDRLWGLGVWQPRSRFDYLSPDQEGLTGAFIDYESKYFQLTGFASPIFIPELGPQFTLEDGYFSSPQPWFWFPPENLPVFGQATRVRYDVTTPSAGDVVANPGASFSARVGENGRGPWGRIGYAYKPVNQLRLSYDGFLELSTPEPEANVQIQPSVIYHELVSTEVGYRSGPMSGWISFLAESPKKDAPVAGQTTQQFSNAYLLSPALQLEVPTRSVLTMSYLHRWRGDVTDIGDLASSGASIFEPRYGFGNSLLFGVETPLVRGLFNRSKFLYDLSARGAIVSTEFRFQPASTWNFTLGADFLGPIGKDGASAGVSTFVSRYRMNDRVHGGVSYVF